MFHAFTFLFKARFYLKFLWNVFYAIKRGQWDEMS